MRRCRTLLILLAPVVAGAPVASAGPVYRSLFVFGDSLSDGGNAYLRTGGLFPPPPYAQRISNGLGSVLLSLSLLPDIRITPFDTFGFHIALVANPAAYGGTNVTDPCFDPVLGMCGSPDHYLYWDGAHPTTYVHELLGNEFADAVGQQAVPEPATLVLLGRRPGGTCGPGVGSAAGSSPPSARNGDGRAGELRRGFAAEATCATEKE